MRVVQEDITVPNTVKNAVIIIDNSVSVVSQS